MFFFFFGLEGGTTFADRLRTAREKAGISGKELAAAVGVKYDTYMSYENRGREPKQETLIKIADKLNITTDELLGVRPPDKTISGDIEKPLTDMLGILQKDTANYRGDKFDERDREELTSRIHDFAKRAETLATLHIFDDNTP